MARDRGKGEVTIVIAGKGPGARVGGSTSRCWWTMDQQPFPAKSNPRFLQWIKVHRRCPGCPATKISGATSEILRWSSEILSRSAGSQIRRKRPFRLSFVIMSEILDLPEPCRGVTRLATGGLLMTGGTFQSSVHSSTR